MHTLSQSKRKFNNHIRGEVLFFAKTVSLFDPWQELFSKNYSQKALLITFLPHHCEVTTWKRNDELFAKVFPPNVKLSNLSANFRLPSIDPVPCAVSEVKMIIKHTPKILYKLIQ